MIIGINAEIGHGKDTLGMILQALTMNNIGTRWKNNPIDYAKAYEGRPNLKGGWDIRKFADKLKEIAGLLLGVPRERFEQQEYKSSYLPYAWDITELHGSGLRQDGFQGGKLRPVTKKMTVREFLIRLGDGTRETVHPEIWVNAFMKDYDSTGLQASTGGLQTYPNWIATDMRYPNEFEAIKQRGGITVHITRPDAKPSGVDHRSEYALKNHNFDLSVVNTSFESLLEAAELILELTKKDTW